MSKLSPHCPTLDVDLNALAANYQLLRQQHHKKLIAAVVKADAYGLGMKAVSKKLWEEGCTQFFVATLTEGMRLREIIPQAKIAVFGGLLVGEEKHYAHYRLTPVLNEIRQVEAWQAFAPGKSAILHVDTGMTRLGLSQSDLVHLVEHHPVFISTSCISMVISHLACAGDAQHPKNSEQLARLHEALALLPGIPVSFANSSGLFISPDYHFDMGRPGCALYGINPCRGINPMQPVVKLSAPILQIRTLDRDETVGYNATYTANKGSRIAVAGFGYADGWLRSLSNKGSAYINGQRVPIAGVVSMDAIALDVSSIPDVLLTGDTRAEFINGLQTVDTVASDSGTIGYEVFTRIGNRVERRYDGI